MDFKSTKSVCKIMEKNTKDEWKGRLKKWGLFLIFWIFFMTIIFVSLAIRKSIQNIEWDLYANPGLIGYTIGASLVLWQINSLFINFSNRKKEHFEKKKPVSVYTWFFLGVILYLSFPIFSGFRM